MNSYQVLARKWRPQEFTDVVGQYHVLVALKNSLQQQRFHHAYLFSGTHGIGKTTIARLFAKALNCETGISYNPCGKCTNCVEISHGRFIDLIEIDAASRTKIEDIRELLDNVQYLPARGRFKVYLIDEVHMLSRYSLNALLKTLEEPPEYVKFFLATTNSQKLPVTVLSRCLKFHLNKLEVDQISSQLERILSAEKILSDKLACQLIAIAAEGSLRDALSLTDQAIAMGCGKVLVKPVRKMLRILDDECLLSIIEAIIHSDSKKAMALVNEIELQGGDWENVLIRILSLLHRIAIIQLLPLKMQQDISSLTEKKLYILARSINPIDIQIYYRTLLIGRKELSYAPGKRTGIEMILLRTILFHHKSNNAKASSMSYTNKIETDITNDDTNHNMNILSTKNKEIRNKKEIIDNTINKLDKKLINTSTLQILEAKKSLDHKQEKKLLKESDIAFSNMKMIATIAAAKRLSVIFARYQHFNKNYLKQFKKNYKSLQLKSNWLFQDIFRQKKETIIKSNNIYPILEYKKIFELNDQILIEAQKRDHWSAEISKLKLHKLVEQFVLNTYKECLNETEIQLRLRSAKRYLNIAFVHKSLTEALCKLYGKSIKLVIIEDDNPNIKTPLEWRQIIYEEKLAQARQSIFMDKTIKNLLVLFDAQLDESSIRPI